MIGKPTETWFPLLLFQKLASLAATFLSSLISLLVSCLPVLLTIAPGLQRNDIFGSLTFLRPWNVVISLLLFLRHNLYGGSVSNHRHICLDSVVRIGPDSPHNSPLSASPIHFLTLIVCQTAAIPKFHFFILHRHKPSSYHTEKEKNFLWTSVCL